MIGYSHLCDVLRAQDHEAENTLQGALSREGMLARANVPAKAEKPARAAKAKPIEPQKPGLPGPNLPGLPFDPIERAAWMESLVMRGDERKYFRFRYQEQWWAPVVADSCGCCLQCAYCWNNSKNQKLPGSFYEPEEIATKLDAIGYMHDAGAYRTGGCEPILGIASARHIVRILQACQGCQRFLLETNGVMLGAMPEIFDMLRPFRDILKIRISAKADSPERFEMISGAKKEFFDLPLQAIRIAQKKGFDSELAYMPEFTDPRILQAVAKWNGMMDGEHLHLYPGTRALLESRGCWKLKYGAPKKLGSLSMKLPGMTIGRRF